MRFGAISFLLAILAWLSGCAAPLLNSNTLDLAATVDDLWVRQIVFNLAKTKENPFALPAQAQIPQGQVSATLSVTPTISSPLNTLITGTSQIASTGAAATITKLDTNTAPNATAGVSGSIGTMQDWVVSPVQDPEQLRRLRLLYQYATGQIRPVDLLCLYPIPQVPDKSATDKSSTDKPDDKKPTKLYIRGLKCEHEPYNALSWVTIGLKPDFAFLNSPGCVLCAYPNIQFQEKIWSEISRHTPIYENVVSNHNVRPEFKNLQKEDIVEVVVNDYLLPNDGSNYENKYSKPIDWLSVVKNGEEPIPNNSRRIGSSNGYTVYVHPRGVKEGEENNVSEDVTSGDMHFSEFVLAIIEATLQSPEIQKSPAPAPQVTTPLR
jgi:hypothetical protein